MAVIRCKMCGGQLQINEGESVAECDYCGTRQTIPSMDNEKKLALFSRANRLRFACEFDKAAGIYESVVAEFPEEAEAYWGLVLCKYGIEYVDDPATGKKIPTCHRSSFDSVMEDSDFEQACENADGIARKLYREEAKQIEELRKGILEVSGREAPYDIFICYKETDENGDRTLDSVLAQDIYDTLTGKGYRVFFSRITLEDKLGQEYEPYIFAALNSAKIMLAVGTDYEYYNAVWVKNEWSRYLKLMAKDKDKHLIPCYKNLDAYDIPKEFARLQAQDLGKVGAMQDLLRGIEKILGAKEDTPEKAVSAAEPVVIKTEAPGVESLLKRGHLFLEDHDWKSADDYFDRVLDIDPECAKAYLGKLMAELHCSRQADLNNEPEPFESSRNYEKVLRFGDEKLKTELTDCIRYIYDRNEHTRLDGIYQQAQSALNVAKTVADFRHAAELFQSIADYEDSAAQVEKCLDGVYRLAQSALSAAKTEANFRRTAELFQLIAEHRDAAALAEKCLELAEAARKDAIYESAISRMTGNQIFSYEYEEAMKKLKTISGWKDADQQIIFCQNKVQEMKEKEEQQRLEQAHQMELRRQEEKKRKKKIKKIAAISTSVVCVCIAFVILLQTVIIPSQKLKKANGLIESGDYVAAYALLEEIERNDVITESKYDRSLILIESGDYVAAYELLNGLNYKDSEEKRQEIIHKYYKSLWKKPEVGSVIFFGTYEQDNNSSNGKEDIEWQILDKKDGKILIISKYALDRKPYDRSWTYITWENCKLRKWLNEDFLNSTFTKEEQKLISTVTVPADKNPEYSTDPGNDTQDQVFLLSISEVSQYFPSNDARICKPTPFTIANNVDQLDSDSCVWWLRSSGNNHTSIAYVDYDGSVSTFGNAMSDINIAVRPALWIDLES